MQRKSDFVPGEYYHLYNRGVDKRAIFKSPYDYQRFTMLLKVANSLDSFRLDQLINDQHKDFSEIISLDTGKKLVSIGAWCLMTNHFHLLVKEETKEGISKFMKKLGTGYSMYFNIKYNRTGSLFGGPFKSVHVSDDIHLRHLFSYIHLNVLDIKFSGWEDKVGNKFPPAWQSFLSHYRYSSYLDYVGARRVEKDILSKKSFPNYFEGKRSFTEFIKDYLTCR
jgi:putative transposase